MTNIATNINIENRAKELSVEIVKEAIKQNIDADMVKKISKEVAKEALFEIVNNGKDRRFQNTKLLMENYKALKKHLNDDEEEDSEVEFKIIDEDGDIIKTEYMWLESVAKSKARTTEMINYVDKKLNYLSYEYRTKGQSEIMDSFIMFYVEEKTDEDIRQEYNCGQHTPRRWREKVIRELSILLWGIDAIKM